MNRFLLIDDDEFEENFYMFHNRLSGNANDYIVSSD